MSFIDPSVHGSTKAACPCSPRQTACEIDRHVPPRQAESHATVNVVTRIDRSPRPPRRWSRTRRRWPTTSRAARASRPPASYTPTCPGPDAAVTRPSWSNGIMCANVPHRKRATRAASRHRHTPQRHPVNRGRRRVTAGTRTGHMRTLQTETEKRDADAPDIQRRPDGERTRARTHTHRSYKEGLTAAEAREAVHNAGTIAGGRRL